MSVALAACGTLPQSSFVAKPVPTSGGPYLLVGRLVNRVYIAFDGFDWRGTRRGTFGPVQICPSQGVGPCRSLQFAPDGSRALDLEQVIGPSGETLGTLPQINNTGYSYSLGEWVWADDSRHLCAVGNPHYSSPPANPGGPGLVGPGLVGPWPGAPTRLYVATAGGSYREVAPLDVGGSNDITTILACSTAADQALTLTQILPGGSEAVVRLSQLSTGATLLDRRITLSEVQAASVRSSFVASPDGRFMAISPIDYNGVTTVLDLSSAQVPSRLIPGRVHGFSYDDSRVVVSGPTGVRVVTVSNGSSVWKSGQSFCGFAERPDAAHSDQAVCVGASFDVWVVPAQGSPQHVATGGLAGLDVGP
ncbi:MAG: hypothetical protein JF887_09255 [Candidatus Dormibacteraeota bacterium]|uniref:Uncharacterized protein n=1 Tax=Candidatus Amunia macphersoniae TaxID=3127014 RepID=A0A934KKX1_9BACT|nr:hypothetical protein [Candidatus Dormibacteraeota bacterium]